MECREIPRGRWRARLGSRMDEGYSGRRGCCAVLRASMRECEMAAVEFALRLQTFLRVAAPALQGRG